MGLRKFLTEKNFLPVALSTGFISYGVLSFEVVLTRLFSVMLSYHFVFAIISFSLLGLGLGGMLLKTWLKRFPGVDYRHAVLFFALFAAMTVIVLIKLPVFATSAFVDLRLWIYIFLTTIPFFFAGLALAYIFREFAEHSSVLYGLDLLGATIGAATVVPLLNIFGAVKAAIVIAAIIAIGAILTGFSARKKALINYSSAGAVLVIAVLALTGYVNTEVPIAMDPNKDLYRFMQNPSDSIGVVETRWSAFGRTDLVRSKRTPESMSIFVDGAAGSAMYNLELLLSSEDQRTHLLRHFGEFFPFYFLEDYEKDNALIIGPGGGRDVVVALLGKVKSITAVEVNPDVVQIVKDYEDFNGGIYSKISNIRTVVQEGRNYLRSSSEKYDLIMLALPITKSSRSVEGYALTENYLFTVEAFEEFLDHLTPEGRIVIVAHSDPEIYRLITLALSAFKQQNIAEADAMKHIYTLASGMMPTLVVKKHPFDSVAANARHKMLHQIGYDRGNYFLPHVQQMVVRVEDQLGIDVELRMFDQILVDISEGRLKMNDLIHATPLDLRPVTDNSPFFYNFEPGLPEPFGWFSLLIFIVVGVLFIFLLIKKNTVAAGIPVLKPFASNPQLKLFLLIFFLLGTGFMLIEISFLQKLTLYIGQPVMALTVLLFSLLLGTGLGSFCSAFTKKNLYRVIAIASFCIILLAIVYNIYLPDLFALKLDPKITAILLLLPLGFFLGFPFPLSIRLMKMINLEQFIDWMWGVNGVASVVGSALTMIMGILSGFSSALYLGIFLYGLVAVLAVFALREKSIPETHEIIK